MLKAKKTYLRAIELEDSRILSAWLNDRETNRYLDITYPLSKRYTDSFVMEGEDITRRVFMVDNEDRKPIGIIVIDNIKWEYRNCEIGIVIYDKAMRGRGYGRDAMERALEFIFDDMNMHMVHLKVAEDNKDAINLYISLGFEAEGILRDRYYRGGKYINLMVMSKIKEE